MSAIQQAVLASGARAITFMASAKTQNFSAQATLALSKPAGTVDGQLMLAFTAGGDTTNGTWTEAAGWAQAVQVSLRATHAAYKVAASEGSSYTLTYSSAVMVLCGAIVTYSNAAYDTAGGTYSGNNDLILPSITVAQNSSLLLAFFSSKELSITFTTPTGMTPLLSDSDGVGGSYALFYQRVNAGATGTRTSTSSSIGGYGLLVSLKPN